jgi:hypothetical protein
MKIRKKELMGIVRHLLTFVGGIIMMMGIGSSEIIVEMVGSAVALSGLVWSIIEKNKIGNE